MNSIGTEPASEPIAIIGLSCKFVGDTCSPEGLWRMMAEGRNAWLEVPSSRFNLKGFFHQDALSAGDPVWAVIRETLLNRDGKKDSITSPSQAAQVVLMLGCYHRARIDPGDTQYFEAHGTGTKVGDPIEAAAIATVFQPGRPASQPLHIGSIKTNIGHSEVTSGLAGIIKVALAMENGLLPPSVNFEQPNPEVALEFANLKVVTEAEQWSLGPNGVRRASINNFGAGGTNAHVNMESADSILPRSEARQPSQKYKTKVLVLSARSDQGCKFLVLNLKDYLETKKGLASEEALLENVMYTLVQQGSYSVPAVARQSSM